MIDEYPVNWSNHVEGLIMDHWKSNKSKECTMTDPHEVPKFVCFFLWKFYMLVLISFHTDMGPSKRLLGKTGS